MTTYFLVLKGSQRPGALHRYPASFARDRGRFLANGLGTKVPPGCHGERGRERETGILHFLFQVLIAITVCFTIKRGANEGNDVQSKKVSSYYLTFHFISMIESFINSASFIIFQCNPFKSFAFFSCQKYFSSIFFRTWQNVIFLGFSFDFKILL